MIEVALCKNRGNQGVSSYKKNKNKCGEQIDAFVILLRLNKNLIPKRIRN